MSFVEVPVGTAPTLVCSVPPEGVTVANTGLEEAFLGGPNIAAGQGESVNAGASVAVGGGFLEHLLLQGTDLYAVTLTANTTLAVQSNEPGPGPDPHGPGPGPGPHGHDPDPGPHGPGR